MDKEMERQLKMVDLYGETLIILQDAFSQLENKIEKPVTVKLGTHDVFRYEKQSIEAAVIQKLARVISGLHASLLLLHGGYVQELGVIFRTLNEYNQDITFLCQAIQTRKITDLHRKYLNEFYQEEFDKPDNPFLSEQKRSVVPRKRVLAAIANIPENDANPSDIRELFRTVSQTYSGYIHGASVHIMDMYGGNPPHFHLSGMLNTPRITEFVKISWNYYYRGLQSALVVSDAFHERELWKELHSFKSYYEQQSGKTEWKSLEEIIKKIKTKEK
jgi:hypothetical protein